MKNLLSTKEVAQFLDVNEKMVYTLISEKGLPSTKITGKWLFPKHLVEQWIETNIINYPEPTIYLPPYQGLLNLKPWTTLTVFLVGAELQHGSTGKMLDLK